MNKNDFPCTHCRLRARFDRNPKSIAGRFWHWHTGFCPGWTNTFSLRVAQYKANPKASVYFCDEKEFRAVELRGTMEVLTDPASKEMIWRDGDNEYYPGGITDPNYCVLRFTATDGRFYSDFSPRSFVL